MRSHGPRPSSSLPRRSAAGCPGQALLPALTARSGAYPDWIGYVSSTAVYGDRDGGWVFEETP